MSTGMTVVPTEEQAPRQQTSEGRRRPPVLRSVAAAILGIALLWWLVPAVTGATWHAVGHILGQLDAGNMTILVLVWIAGLMAHTWVLTAALPGLSHSRAITLNLTGSAVSNIAPLGGALGVATNLKMTRTWRIRDSAFAAFTLVTNIWDVLAKLSLPLLALLVLVTRHDVQLPSLRAACIAASVVIALTIAALVAWLADERAAAALGRWAGWLVARLPGRLERGADAVPEHLRLVRHDTIGIVRARWHQMSLAMAGYLVLQTALLWACLRFVGVPVAVQTVLVAFALERLSTLAFLTPGGVGIGEAATIAAMVALGSPPAETAAGLLLFRFFTYLVEIPVGGLWLAGWLISHQHDGRRELA